MRDYIIYKICKTDCDYVYVGSTSGFNTRKYNHKKNCMDITKNNKLYLIIRENGGWNAWSMIVLDEIKNCSRTDARIREQKFMDNLECTINMSKAYTSKEEKLQYDKDYHKNNREYHKQYYKQYYLNKKNNILIATSPL